jgi:hypothetical protein
MGIIRKAIAESREELIGLQSKVAPVLNWWERACLGSQRVYPRLRRMVPLFMAAAVAGWAILATAGFVALCLGLSYVRAIDPTEMESIFPPNITPESRISMLILTAVAVVFLAMCLAVRAFSQMSDKRLKVYRRWYWQQTVRIPQLKGRIAWLEGELSQQKLNLAEAIELEKTKSGSDV